MARITNMRWERLAVGLPFLVLLASTHAQQLPTFEVSFYIGQNVSSVDIAGRPDVTLKKVQDLISVSPGKPLSQKDIDSSIAALKQLGGFQDVKLDLQPLADGVRLTFILEPAVYVAMYNFPGALKEFTYSRLLQVANYNAEAPYSASVVQQAEDALIQFFRQQGYFLAEVSPEIVSPSPGLVNIQFQTDLGAAAKIGDITLLGSTPEETNYLQQKLRSVMARLRGNSLKPGMRYSYNRLEGATRYLQSALTRQNYIAGQVKLISAEYDPHTNRADITFQITTGPVMKVSSTGARIWRRTFRSLVPMFQENTVNDDLIREGQNNIRSYFQAKGYFDTVVDVKESKTSSGVSITYDIHKDSRFKVSEVAFNGNRHFDNQELQQHVSVEEGHLLRRGKYSEALVRSSVKNLRDTYRAAGFSEAEIVPNVIRKNGNVEITFQVTEGPLDVVRELRVEGNNALPEAQLAPPPGLNLGPGRPYSQELVTKDRNQIMARYLTLGFLNASFRSTAKAVPGEAHQLDVVYRISEGPRVKTATIITDGRQHTRQSAINRELKISPGEPLSENALLSSESHLYNLEIFDWAQVDPKRAITDQTQEDVVVKVHEAKRNSIVYGFGFQVFNRGGKLPSGTVAVPGIPPVGVPNTFVTSQQTFWGPDGTFEYTRRNLRGRAESFTFSAFAARLNQTGSLTYTQPSFLGTSWKSSSNVSGEHDSQNPIFTDRVGSLGYQLQKPLNTKKTTNLFLRYNFQLTRISNLLIPELVPPNQLNVHLSTLSASWVHDTRDNVLDAHRGIYQNYEIGINPAWLGSNFSFAEFVGQTAYYKNIHSGIIWANSIRLGLKQAYAGSEVPLSSRFFSGGGSTLRGFPLNGAGPQRTIVACGNPNDPATCSKITVPAGGNELLILNTELRFPLNIIKQGLGLVTFYDGGNVFPSIGFHDFTSLYSNTVGIGFRYATPVGPIRIDIGHNLNPVPGLKATQVFVTLGQAF